MSSYLEEDSTCHPEPNHPSQQRLLEIMNKQLEEQLRDKQDSLQLQVKILTAHTNHHDHHSSAAIVEQLLQKQQEISSFFTQKLIQKQLQIEQAKQMSEIINNYEKRIADLRSVLINKEGEISAATYQFLRGTVTRRQNLQAINSQTLQKIALSKYARERKKLEVEIEALQFTINQMQKAKPGKKRRSELKDNEQAFKEKVFKKNVDSREHKPEIEYFNAFSGSRQQDLLTDKVAQLIVEEMDKYNHQSQLAEQLKRQLQLIEAETHSNLQKYKKAEQEWSRVGLRNQQPCLPSKNKIQYQLSFIKELQQEISNTNTNSELIASELFSSRDTNKVETPAEIPKGAKHSTTLKQRRRGPLKQN